MVNLKSWKVYTISYTQQYRDVIESLGEKALGLRRHIFETARKALWFIMDTMEDDVKCISKIIAIYSECLMFHELYKNEYDNHWKIFSNGKKAMQDIVRFFYSLLYKKLSLYLYIVLVNICIYKLISYT